MKRILIMVTLFIAIMGCNKNDELVVSFLSLKNNTVSPKCKNNNSLWCKLQLEHKRIFFKVCNKSSKQLLKYSFIASGFNKGKSTPLAVGRKGDRILNYRGVSGRATEFTSDEIIEPNSCKEITFLDDYREDINTKVISSQRIWSK